MPQQVKNPPAMLTQEMQIWSWDREDPLEKEMATHSSILAWEIPWTGSLAGDRPWGCKELDTLSDWEHEIWRYYQCLPTLSNNGHPY